MKTLMLVFLVLSTPQIIHAASSSPSQSCCDASCSKKKWAICGQIDVSAEALLWRLATPGFDYVKSSENQIGTFILNKPVYDWGVRVCAGYRFPSCWETKASYLYFKTRFTDTRTSNGNPILTPLLIFGPGVVPLPQRFASAKAEDCFQAVDVSLSPSLSLVAIGNLKPLVELDGSIKEGEKITSISISQTTQIQPFKRPLYAVQAPVLGCGRDCGPSLVDVLRVFQLMELWQRVPSLPVAPNFSLSRPISRLQMTMESACLP